MIIWFKKSVIFLTVVSFLQFTGSLQSPNNLSNTLLTDIALPETLSTDQKSIGTVFSEMTNINSLCQYQSNKPILPNSSVDTSLHQVKPFSFWYLCS